MHPEIAKLTEVHQVDAEILELQEQLNRYPAQWEEVKTALRAKTSVLDAAKAKVENHEVERRRLERELRDSMERLKRYQTQQMMVKTSKELTAVNTQIEGVKRKIGQYEEYARELLERDKEVRKEVEEAEGVLAEAKKEAVSERERIRRQVASKKKRITSLEKDREKLVANVAASVVRQYERAWKRHPGTAIVPLHNGSCAGCHFALLPNKLVIVHLAQEIVRCDHCGRILSHDPDQKPEEAGAAEQA